MGKRDRENEAIDDACTRARCTLESRLEGVAPDEAAEAETRAHLTTCRACATFGEQMAEIVAAAAALPQFDVSEALTQRILASAPASRPAPPAASMTMPLMAAAAALWMYLLVVVSVESVDGLMSWAVSLVLMVVLRLIIGGKREDLAVEGG